MRLIVSFASILLMGLMAPAQARNAVPEAAASAIDLPRFMGTWYVIGRIPNPVERGQVASRDEYTLDDDGKINIHYLYRDGFGEPEQEKNFHASVVDDSGNREWRVWFYRIIPTRQRVLEVAPDYSWALLDYPGHDMAWIFARSPQMSREQYRELVDRMRDKYGIYTDKLKRVAQFPEQVNKLGFEIPNKP